MAGSPTTSACAAPWKSIASNGSPWSLVNALNQGRIRKLVVITVNARSDPDLDWDQRSQAPGILEVLNTAAGASIDNDSFETIDLCASSSRSTSGRRASMRAAGRS